MKRTTHEENIYKRQSHKQSLMVCSLIPRIIGYDMDFLDISGLYSKKEDNYYEAYERDIAVVHFFFQVT